MLLIFTDVFVVHSAYFSNGSNTLKYSMLVGRVSTFPRAKRLCFYDGP